MMKLFPSQDECIRYFGFNDRWLLVYGTPILGLILLVVFFKVDFISMTRVQFFSAWLQICLNVIFYWVLVSAYTLHLRKQFPSFRETQERLKRIAIFIIAIGIISCPIINFSLDILFNLPFKDPSIVEGYAATYFTTFFVTSIYEGFYLYEQSRVTVLAQEKQKREHIKSELHGLRNQVNPHFLFNSMNTLMNIIPEDQELAVSFLQKLSRVYRYLLERREDFLIPLKEELDFIESYVFLQKERFKHKLIVSIEIPEAALDLYLLPLSLQLLFENAIKHNVISDKYPLKIRVYTEGADTLVVTNNLKQRPQSMPSTGVGLQNIRARYAYFTERELEVITTQTTFTVNMPLLDQQAQPLLP